MVAAAWLQHKMKSLLLETGRESDGDYLCYADCCRQHFLRESLAGVWIWPSMPAFACVTNSGGASSLLRVEGQDGWVE